jgi:hypothetical protein
MGLFDTYAGCQLKVGDVELNDFEVGDTVKIPDGIYIALEGIIVIKNGILVCGPDEKIFDKWGDEIDPKAVVNLIKGNNPVQVAIDNADSNPKNQR